MRNKSKLSRKKPELLREGEFNILITDDLTHTRASIRKALLETPGTVRVNTINGKLLYTYKGNDDDNAVTVSIDSPLDLMHKLGWPMEKLRSLGLCVDAEDFDTPE